MPDVLHPINPTGKIVVQIGYNDAAFKSLIAKADFEASNPKILCEPEKWQEKTIAVSGNLIESHLLKNQLQGEYCEFPCSYNNYLINIVCVFFRNLPRQKDVT